MHIGIDLGGTKIEGIILNTNGKEIARSRIPTLSGNYEKTIAAIRDLISQLCANTSVNNENPVGIGIPGAVSPSSGLTKNANSTCLIGKDLSRDLLNASGHRIQLANDADCFAISEAVDGAGENFRTVFGIILGTGCGGGFVVDRKILSGPNAIAGEWGHNPIPWATDNERPGPTCYCGKNGCIETFVSGPGLSKAFQNLTGENFHTIKIAGLAESGHKQAEQFFSSLKIAWRVHLRVPSIFLILTQSSWVGASQIWTGYITIFRDYGASGSFLTK
jgi:fructokinase